MAITTALVTSFKVDILRGDHDFTTTTGDACKFGLFDQASGVAGTYGAASTVYADITGGADELAGTGGYTTGGYAITAANNVTPTSTGAETKAWLDFAVDPNWTTSTFITSGGFLYNTATALRVNSLIAVFDFGGDKSVSSGTFTVQFPAAASATAIIQIA